MRFDQNFSFLNRERPSFFSKERRGFRGYTMKRKAFIGPLGDDIPSIFPIVAGMLLFIGSILYVNAQVDERNADLALRQATQKLAYLSTAKGSFLPGEFSALCSTSIRPFAENNGLKFAVVLKRQCSGIELVNSNAYREEEGIDVNAPWNNDYVCTSNNPNIQEQYRQARQVKDLAPKDAVTLIYPVAVPCPDLASPTNGLGTINVIVWK